jgi:isoquinoline 1-oxidoreductase beta subunit
MKIEQPGLEVGLQLSRRRFIVGSSGAGLVMAFAGLDAAPASAQQAIAARIYAPTLWWEIGPDGIVQINCIKIEMGHHIGTAFGRIVAEELEVDWKDVRVVHVDSHTKWGFQETGGSTSIFGAFESLSRAGAAGRITLIEAGAAMMGAPAAECRARDSKVIHGSRSVSYAEIVRAGKLDRVFTREDLAKLPIKVPAERRKIGTSVPQLDIRSKTDGSAKYGIDATMPGMIFARPLPPPTRMGAKVVSVDDSAARKTPGYIGHVVIDDPTGLVSGWVTVAAETYWAAVVAADALKVTWTPGPQAKVDEAALHAESDRLCADPKAGGLWVKEGDVDAALAGAAKTVTGRYTTSTALHFPLEPVNAVAGLENGVWQIHMGVQWQSLIRPIIAKAVGVTDDEVVLRTYYLGGGFGRRLWADYGLLAALSAKALGRPVKLIATRPDDSQMDCVRSPSVATFKAGFDAAGKLIAMDHAAAAGWASASISPNVVREAIKGGGPVDRYSIMGGDHWYSVPNQRVRAIKNELAHQTIVPGWLRGVGPAWVVWGVETFMDEVAYAAGQDPAAFRLALLDGVGRNSGDEHAAVGGAARLRTVLQRALTKAGWGKRLPPDTALGVACSHGQERDMPTWTTCVAQVHVDRKTGVIKVQKLTHVLDCGTRIDPDGALAQAEGGSLWGVSLALHESTRVEAGRHADENLDTYTPLRMSDVPEMDIEFIDNTGFPTGMGEPPVHAVGPAIGNAVYAAVGVRLRDLPMRPDHVLRELPRKNGGR